MQDIWDSPSLSKGVKIYTDEDEETFIVSDVVRYMDFNSDYQNDFVCKVNDFLNEKGYITQNQLDVIRSIIKHDETILEFVQERREVNW